jgi:hypothetical protein
MKLASFQLRKLAKLSMIKRLMGRNYTWHLHRLPLKDKVFSRENSLDSKILRRSATSL